MDCFTCFDHKVIWVEDKYGRATCGPCPICNLHGNAVRKETEKFEKKIDEMKVREVFSEERKRRTALPRKRK